MDKILLVFPSFATDQRFYKNLIKSAPSDWKVFIMDYKDLTKSGNFDSFEEKVLDFLDKYGLKDVNLLGFSIGGILTLKFSHKYPSKVKKLFLIDSAGLFFKDTYWRMFFNSCLANTNYLPKHPIQLLRLIHNFLSRPIWYKAQWYFGKNTDLSKIANQVKVPTLIFWGEKDKLIPSSYGQKLHLLIPNSKFITLKNKNHDWILSNPELFWKEVQ